MIAQPPNITDWIQATAASISALGLIMVFLQVRLTQKGIYEDHSRARKERAIDVIEHFSEYITEKGSAAKTLGERMTREQAEAIWREVPFTMDAKYKSYIEATMPDFGALTQKRTGDADIIEISRRQSSVLRRAISGYLNQAEVALASARHGVAEEGMVLEQFQFLINPERNWWALKEFREIAGGKKAFPSLHWFIGQALRNEEAPLPRHRPTGTARSI